MGQLKPEGLVAIVAISALLLFGFSIWEEVFGADAQLARFVENHASELQAEADSLRGEVAELAEEQEEHLAQIRELQMEVGCISQHVEQLEGNLTNVSDRISTVNSALDVLAEHFGSGGASDPPALPPC